MGCMCASERVPGKAKKNEESLSQRRNNSIQLDKKPKNDNLKRARTRQRSLTVTHRPVEVFHRLKGTIDSYYSPKSVLRSSSKVQLELRCYPPSECEVCLLSIQRSGEKEENELQSLRPAALTRALLDHPHILRPFVVLFDENRFYVAMEPFKGGSLCERLMTAAPFAECEVAAVTRQLLLAVSHCHHRKVPHGGISPASIAIVQECALDIKLTGFCMLDSLPGESDPRFTSWKYLAPEALANPPSAEADIWSCGAVVYTLFEQQSPFATATSKKSLARLHMQSLRFSSPRWSRDAVSLVTRMLSRDPAQRPTALECLGHPWLACTKPSNTLLHLNYFLTRRPLPMLKETIMRFVLTRILTHSELAEYRCTFSAVDTLHDGVLTEPELAAWVSTVVPVPEVQGVVQDLLSTMETDGDGEVTYTEFLLACIGSRTLLSADNLKRAFRCFDRDGSGTVTVEELRSFFQKKYKGVEREWRDAIKKLDRSGDGKVSLAVLKDALADNVE